MVSVVQPDIFFMMSNIDLHWFVCTDWKLRPGLNFITESKIDNDTLIRCFKERLRSIVDYYLWEYSSAIHHPLIVIKMKMFV